LPSDASSSRVLEAVRKLEDFLQTSVGSPFLEALPVSGLTVAKKSQYFDVFIYTLTWNDVNDDRVSHYNIYVTGLTGPLDNTKIILGAAHKSPAQVPVTKTQTNRRLTFTIQTVLRNGIMSDLATAPSTTAID